MPCTTIEDAVAEGKEAFVLPTELRDWFSRFSSFIEELLEASQLFLFCQPDIVTDTLYLLFETAETDEVFGFELNDTLIMIFVLNLKETERIRTTIRDMKERFEREVREMRELLHANNIKVPRHKPTEHPIRKDAFGWEGERPEGNK